MKLSFCFFECKNFRFMDRTCIFAQAIHVFAWRFCCVFDPEQSYASVYVSFSLFLVGRLINLLKSFLLSTSVLISIPLISGIRTFFNVHPDSLPGESVFVLFSRLGLNGASLSGGWVSRKLQIVYEEDSEALASKRSGKESHFVLI